MFRKTAIGGFLALALLSGGEATPRAQNPQAPPTPQATPSPEAAPTPQATPSPAAIPTPKATATPEQDFQQHSYFDATAKWPERSIYVCWENPDDRYSDEMALVRKSVAESWEAASAVRFTGWQRCAPENMGIRILIDDSGPHTKGLGVNLNGRVNGMVLNFTFNNWRQSCRNTLALCTKSIAVHEFGHALGFAHEQNRPDTPGECLDERQGSNGTVMLTPYDPQSVMNYCNPAYNNLGVLSRYDAEAVQKIYGRSVLNPTGIVRE